MNSDNQSNNSTNPTDDQTVNQISDQVWQNIMVKIADKLSEDDIAKIEELDKDDPDGSKVKAFLFEKVPNMETIIFEELQSLQKQASQV